MALIQVNYLSKALSRQVTFNALIPIDMFNISNKRKINKTNLKSLYLLNGYFGNYMDWTTRTKIQDLSNKYNIAVFMPSGENSFYIDDASKNQFYGEFVGNEIVEYTRSLFPLSTKREHTTIGGLSMGGYGATINGLKYYKNYGAIIALSSAFIINDIVNMDCSYKDEVGDYNFYKNIFGDPKNLKGTDKDEEALLLSLDKNMLPRLYIACGTEDLLIDQNRKYHDFLNKHNIQHTYTENTGKHDWDFWDEYIQKALDWLLAH